MREKSCALCKSNAPLVWTDYEKNIGPFGLCYNCFRFVYPKDAIKMLPFILYCDQCQKKFLLKKPGQTRCNICWKKYFDKKISIKHTIGPKDIEQKQDRQRLLEVLI